MEIVGLHPHERESQRSIKADDGTITERRISSDGPPVCSPILSRQAKRG